MSTNWIQSKSPSLSSKDKVKSLLRIGHKLVMVQRDELERIKNSTKLSKSSEFVDYLYNHYVINNSPKTYM